MSIYKAMAAFDACPGSVVVESEYDVCPPKYMRKYVNKYKPFGDDMDSAPPKYRVNMSASKSDLEKSIKELVALMKAAETDASLTDVVDEALDSLESQVEEISAAPNLPNSMFDLSNSAVIPEISTVIVACKHCDSIGQQGWRQAYRVGEASTFVFVEHPCYPGNNMICPGTGLRLNEARVTCPDCGDRYTKTVANDFDTGALLRVPHHSSPSVYPGPYEYSACPGSATLVGLS